MFKLIAGRQVYVPLIEQRQPLLTETERFAMLDAHYEALDQSNAAVRRDRAKAHRSLDVFPALKAQDHTEDDSVTEAA